MDISKNTKVKDLLPLGSVVNLKDDENNRFMITEYYINKKAIKEGIISDKSDPSCDVFDYMAINWYENDPDGVQRKYLFNKNRINKVLFYGYVTDESINLMKGLEAFLEKNK